ncbi:MAG: hypothetical protein R3F65_28015 [bacterium]
MSGMGSGHASWVGGIEASFDAAEVRLAALRTTLTEAELIAASHWALGEDARLREDMRFRPSPWGRWLRAVDLLANEALYRRLHAEGRGATALGPALDEITRTFGRRCVFCPADPRFVLRGEVVHLAASELSRHPVIEAEVGALERYATHLPLYSLRAAAASAPAGEWGPGAAAEAIEALDWIEVTLPRRLDERMFVARIEGHSMDDGRSGLVDGGYAVFAFWPASVEADARVLVRGAFHDPETGSYAVKRLVDETARPVVLRSLNPDRERYPDIEVHDPEGATLAVVAEVVCALGPDDYARRPRPVRRPGRRVIEGSGGLGEQGERLERRIAAFFAEGAAADEGDEGDEGDAGDDVGSAAAGWCGRLVCLAVEAGGVHLELGPLAGLPRFVKTLRAMGRGGEAGRVLAGNVRERPDRAPVPPGSGPWRFEAVGFEDDEDLGLERLAVEGLPEDVVSVFRVDASEVGRRVGGTTLAAGQLYRLLLPPALAEGAPGEPLVDGWRLWSLDLGAEPDPATRAALGARGLSVGEPWPRLRWALTAPAAWRATARGEGYPVFEAGSEVFVEVGGLPVDEGEAAALFVRGAGRTERMMLPCAPAALVSLGALDAGRWACAVLHPRTAVRRATVVFEVAADATRHVAARWAVGGERVDAVAIEAPPGWPVSLRWRVLAEVPLATVHGGDDGVVDLSRVAPLIAERARGARVADLVVDLAELGRRVVAHDARPGVDEVGAALVDLWTKRAALLRGRSGEWARLVPSWFAPVVAHLGYVMEPIDEASMPSDEMPWVAWRLLFDDREDGRIRRGVSRVLVLATDLDAVADDHLDAIDRVCKGCGVRDAIFSDGIRWKTHRVGGRLRRRVWDLAAQVEAHDFEQMLIDLAEGL